MESDLANLPHHEPINNSLNDDLYTNMTEEETEKVISSLKLGKTVSTGNFPNEILKNKNLHIVLCKLFNACLKQGQYRINGVEFPFPETRESPS